MSTYYNEETKRYENFEKAVMNALDRIGAVIGGGEQETQSDQTGGDGE